MNYIKAIPLENEKSRILALKSYRILDTNSEKIFDDLVYLASHICETETALISLVDENRQWFKARLNFESSESPRETSFCGHAINEPQVFIIEDSLLDERFKKNPLVINKPNIRFYAGAQLKDSNGFILGTLCVIDKKPKKLNEKQIYFLETLARQVVVNIENIKKEFELKESSHFFTNIVSMLPDLISYIDSNYIYRYVNNRYEEWFSIKSDQVIGLHVKEIIGEVAFKKARPFMNRALKGEKQTFELEMPYVVNGIVTTRIIKGSYIPDKASNGIIKGFYAVVTDISELKKAELKLIDQNIRLEEALQKTIESEKKFRTVYDNSPMGILQLNSKLKFIASNQAFSNFLGYEEDELKYMTILDVTHPDDLQKTIENLINYPKETGFLNRFEKRYIHKSGAIIWGLVTSRAVQFDKSTEISLFSVIEDITELKNKDSQLELVQSKLIHNAKMASLGLMAGGIAHEINNPLAIIKGKTDILIDRISKGQLDQVKIINDIGVINKTTDRIAKIITGMRAFSRQSEADPFVKRNVNEIIQETLALCQERYKNYSINLQYEPGADFLIDCRPAQISQVLLNLLNNAFDAIINLEDKWVKIQFSSNDEFVFFKITDSGAGIPSIIVDKLMDPFFTTKEIGRGTGLGLSISKGIAESHSGKLYYEADVENTTFVLQLPINQNFSNSIHKLKQKINVDSDLKSNL